MRQKQEEGKAAAMNRQRRVWCLRENTAERKKAEGAAGPKKK